MDSVGELPHISDRGENIHLPGNTGADKEEDRRKAKAPYHRKITNDENRRIAKQRIEAVVRLKSMHFTNKRIAATTKDLVESLKKLKLEDLSLAERDELVCKVIKRHYSENLVHHPYQCQCQDSKGVIVKILKDSHACIVNIARYPSHRLPVIPISRITSLKTKKYAVKTDSSIADSKDLPQVGDTVIVKKPEICPIQLRKYLKQLHLKPSTSPLYFICSHALFDSFRVVADIVNSEDPNAFSQLLALEDVQGRTPLFSAVNGTAMSNQMPKNISMNKNDCIARMKMIRRMMQHNIRLSHRDRSGKTIYDCLVNKPDMYSYILLKTIAAVTNRFQKCQS